jgi:hypothetical protein
MVRGGQVSTQFQRYVAEVLIVLVPVTAAVYVSSLSLRASSSVLLGSLIAAIAGKYVTVHLPLVSFRDRELTTLLDHYLELMVIDYKRKYPGNYRLRANIMIPDSDLNIRFKGPGRGPNREQFLQIGYDSGGYAEMELRRRWRLGQGCVGKSYKNNEQRVAARRTNETTWGTEWEMNPEQVKATEEVNSVLCTPIYKPGDETKDEPIAILSLDSSDTVSEAGFKEEEIQDMVAREYANRIGILL